MDHEKRKTFQSGLGKIGKKLYQKRLTIILIAVCLGVFSAFFGNNIVQLHRLSQQKKSLENEIAYEQKLSESLDQELKTAGEKSYIEKIARNTLNMYYPDEKIVTIVYSDNHNGSESIKE